MFDPAVFQSDGMLPLWHFLPPRKQNARIWVLGEKIEGI